MLARTLTLLVSLAFGVLASQLPEFAQQYRQRLGGAVDELSRVVERFDADARAEGLSREDALKRYAAPGDAFLDRRRRSMGEAIARLEKLRRQQREVAGDAPFARLLPVYAQLDGDVARETMRSYEPAVPVTAESAGLGGLGLLFGRLLAPILGFAARRGGLRGARA